MLSANGGSIRDVAGNAASLTHAAIADNNSYLVDTTTPTVLSVSVPVAGEYKSTKSLDFTVNFSEAIDLATLSAPTLSLRIGSDLVSADYAGATSGTSSALHCELSVATWVTVPSTMLKHSQPLVVGP